ncbi:MAG: ABC transporter ATP-binding protein [Lentisphaeria bacterium]|nr:ABC transporter ATP-binding protein [Lentisphaeria bacterium]
MLRRFLNFYRPYRWLFWLDMTCVVVAGAIDLAFPQFLKLLTNGLFKQKGEVILRCLGLLAAGLVVMYLVRYVCNYITLSLGHIMGAKMEADMRKQLFQQYQKLSFSYYDTHNTGEMISRLVNDLFDITEVAHHGPETLLMSGVKIIGAFILLLTIDVKLTMLLFAVTMVMGVFTFIQNRRLRRIFTDNRKKIAAINSEVMDSLSGIRVVKSFSNEEFENQKFDNCNNRFLESKKASYRAMGLLHGGNSFFEGMLYIVIIAGGGYMVATDAMKPEALAIYALYVGIFLHPLNMLLHFTEQFQRGYTGFKRFDEIMNLTPEIRDADDAVEITDLKGNVVYDNVNFFYEKDIPVLNDISFKLEPGKTVALVGTSGGGKSTICALLPRFYDVISGSITIDGVDVRKIKLDFLRRHIGIVQQDLYMFNGTVKENIAYGKPGASDDEIIAAARKAHIHDFIMELPHQYDTLVGERGVRLSGGQKQRISIARVFLKDPEILILDEATSALDNESERKIQQALAELAVGRATLVIAHRLSTIRNADEIIVIEDGRAAERGNHNSLMALNGIYAKLTNM